MTMNWRSTPVSITRLLRRIGNNHNQQASGPAIHSRGSGKPGELIRTGDAASRERRWSDAEQAYAEALRRDPRLAAIWVQLGHSLKEQGFFGRAEEAYRRALALDDGVADTHLQLGHVLKLQSRFDEAIAAYGASYALDEHSQARDELRALGVDHGISVPAAGLFGRDRREPADFPPDIVAKRADSSDIRALHLLLLGRAPEDWRPFGTNQGRPIIDVTRDLVQSTEFHRLILVPLIAGRPTAHDRLGQTELEFVRSWLDRLAGGDEIGGLGWIELLRRYLDQEPVAPVFARAVLGSLQPVLEALNGRELIGKHFGQEGISIQLLVDGEVADEFAINGADRLREDISEDGWRFHLALPVEAFDGRDHEIVVRDAKTQAALPPGRFTARLVPRLEGLIVGSCTRLTGWVRRAPPSDHRVSVEIRDGARAFCSTLADQPTTNPLAGDHGFDLNIPVEVPGSAAIYLDGFPITLLTDDLAAPIRLSQNTWQISLGRSDVLVLNESAIEPVPLALGFNPHSIAEGIRRYGHRYVLDGIQDLAVRGKNPNSAIREILRYVAISKDYVLFQLLRREWMYLLAGDPVLFEQSLRLSLNGDDLDGAYQMLQAARNSERKMIVSVDLLQATLDCGKRGVESARSSILLDPFAITPRHRDAVNSAYHTLVITVERQRMLIEKLLNAVEARNMGRVVRPTGLRE
jgi:hypothetical protein